MYIDYLTLDFFEGYLMVDTFDPFIRLLLFFPGFMGQLKTIIIIVITIDIDIDTTTIIIIINSTATVITITVAIIIFIVHIFTDLVDRVHIERTAVLVFMFITCDRLLFIVFLRLLVLVHIV